MTDAIFVFLSFVIGFTCGMNFLAWLTDKGWTNYTRRPR